MILINVATAIAYVRAPVLQAPLAPSDIAENGGFAFTAPLHLGVRFPYRVRPDDILGGSVLTLREDGRPLGPPHALHQTIRDLGQGRFSHWRGEVYFSASDNTDPRTNGRAYLASGQAIVSPTLVAFLIGIDAIIGISATLGGSVYLGPRLLAIRPFRHRAARIAAGISLLAFASAFLLISPIFRHLAVLLAASGAVLYLASRPLAGASWCMVGAAPAPPPVFARRDGLLLAALLFGVALVFYFGPLQIYPAPGWADPSIYHGYFSHYSSNLSFSGVTYFSERLAFIMPGIVFFKILPVPLAYYGLALLPTAVCSAALYVVVRDFAGSAIALGAVALVCVNALLVGATGQGYLSGIVLAGLFAGFACLLHSATRQGAKGSSFAAGACFAVAVFTNPVAVLHLPGTLGGLLLVYPNARTRLIARLGWGASGGLLVLCGFALANKALTGSFDFVTPALRQAGNAESTQFAMPTSLWVTHATRLWYLVIEVACGFLVLLRCRPEVLAARKPAALALYWAVLSLSSTGAVFVASDVLLKTAYLTYWFYSCYFVIYAAVVAAAILALTLPAQLSRRGQGIVVLGCALGGVLAVLGPLMTQNIDPERLQLQAVSLAGGAACLGLLAFATASRAIPRPLRIGCCLLATAIPLVILDLNPDTRHFFVYRDPSFRDAAVTSSEADRFISDSLGGHFPLFWYSRDDYTRQTTHPRAWRFPNNGIYPLWFKRQLLFNVLDQIWCNYYTPLLQDFDDARPLGEAVPDWRAVLDERRPSSVVVLSLDPEDGLRAVDRASTLFGATLVMRAHDYISHGKFAVHVWVLDVANRGEPRPESEHPPP